MAHIVDFTIIGLAGREGAYSQKMNRDVNVFFGANGSGKTSLLKILDSAMANDTSNLSNVIFESAEVHIYSIDHDRVYTYSIKRTVDGNVGQRVATRRSTKSGAREYSVGVVASDDTESESHGWAISPRPKRISGLEHRYLPISRLYASESRIPFGYASEFEYAGPIMMTPARTETQLDRYFERSLRDLWSTYSTHLLTEVRKAQEDGLADILKDILSPDRERISPNIEVDPETAFRRVSAFLKRQGSGGAVGGLPEFRKRYQNDLQLKRVVSDINEVEAKIEQAIKPRERVQELIDNMFSGNKRVEFRDTDIVVHASNKQHIDLRQLSSGEKQLLRIFVETLLAAQNTIMVDEPELSMHIDWQRRLVNAMTLINSSAQLILATHSPEIMADVEDDRIFRL